MAQLDVLKDISEVIHYNIADYPFYYTYGDLTHFPGMKALCHWHEDLEYIYVTKGHMHYSVSGQNVILQEGEALLINSRQLHYGYSADGTNCEYFCVLFHPSLLATSDYLDDTYIKPVLQHTAFQQILLTPGDPDPHIQTLRTLYASLQQITDREELGFELKIQSLLPAIWLEVYEIFSQISTHTTSNKDLSIQQNMIDYIHQHYHEKLSLSDIAQAGGVCNSQCCHLFKNYLQQSPINFLNQYRLEQSIELLISSQASITNIALSCGFNGSSYFTELFHRYKGCTPTEYRQIARIEKTRDI